jgi:hypothetical protein
MYLDQEGVGIELSRAGYEGGEWARSVEEAYCKGWEMKEAKRRKEYEFFMKLKKMDIEGVESTDERRLSEREKQGRDMARGVVKWLNSARESMQRQEDRNAVISLVAATAIPEVLSAPLLPIEVEAKGIVVA